MWALRALQKVPSEAAAKRYPEASGENAIARERSLGTSANCSYAGLKLDCGAQPRL